MENEERGRRNGDVRFETIRSEKVNFGRNNFLEVARKRATASEGGRSSSPCPEATIFRTRRSASSVPSRFPTGRRSARLSRTRFARSSPRGWTLCAPRNQTAAFKSKRVHPSQPFCTRIRGEYHGPIAEAGPWLSRLGPRGDRGIFRAGPRRSPHPVPLDHVPVHLGSPGRWRSPSS